MRGVRVAVLLVAGLAGSAAGAGADAAPDWREQAVKAGLAPAAIERLATDGLVVGPEIYRQVFTPYLGDDVLPFVTSDALLAAYHVLLEASMVRLERGRGPALAAAIARTGERLTAVAAEAELLPELVAPALARARLVLSVARVLLDRRALPGADAVASLVAWIEEGKPAGLAEWIEDGSLDASVFRPRGFYDRDDGLRRTFRAVRWLQTAPFRIEEDVDLAAWVLLVLANDGREDAFRGDGALVGFGDRSSLAHPAFLYSTFVPVTPKTLVEARAALLRREGPAAILSSGKTPEWELLAAVADREPGDRAPGPPLAAALGSAWARDRLDSKSAGLLAAHPVATSGPDLSSRYLGCVASLLDEADPDAPALFSTEPWRRKSAQTVLAGWTQLRHSLVLHVMESSIGPGAPGEGAPAGFVEPDPVFFARFAELAQRTRSFLARHDAFSLDTLRADAARGLRLVARRMATRPATEFLDGPWSELTAKEWLDVHAVWRLFAPIGFDAGDVRDMDEAAYAAAREHLLSVADVLDDRGATLPPDLAEALSHLTVDHEDAWRDLTLLATELRAQAERQLREAEPSEGERELFCDFARRLASILHYRALAMSRPRDDAPRVVTWHPDLVRKRFLHAATARPRALWLVYPWRGRDYLARGVVVPYREFEAENRLTEGEWKALLDSGNAPRTPVWAAGLEVR